MSLTEAGNECGDPTVLTRERPAAPGSWAARRPSGLAPAPGGENRINRGLTVHELVAKSLDILGADAERPATMRDIFETAIAVSIKRVFSESDFLSAQLAGLRDEIAALKAALAEARLQNRELSLEIRENRAPGRDGRQGLPGPRGARGEKGAPGVPGQAAPNLAGFEVDTSRFCATLRYVDGSTGPTLDLMGFFKSYNAAVNEIDEAAEESGG